MVWLLGYIGFEVKLVDDIGLNVMFARWDNGRDGAVSLFEPIAMPGSRFYETYQESNTRYPFLVAVKRDDSGVQKCNAEGQVSRAGSIKLPRSGAHACDCVSPHLPTRCQTFDVAPHRRIDKNI